MVVSLHFGGQSHVSHGQNVYFKEPTISSNFLRRALLHRASWLHVGFRLARRPLGVDHTSWLKENRIWLEENRHDEATF